jgi:hypothetical protein
MHPLAVVVLAVVVSGCARQDVWVKPGATEADFQIAKGHCLGAAYSQVASAPAVMTLGTGYQSPMITNCSAMGAFASCTTTGGQYTPPVNIPYDANVGARKEVYRGCMYSEGWSLQRQSDAAASVPGDSDWTKGLNWGVKNHRPGACDSPPPGITKPDDWQLGCHSGQKG